MKHRNGFVSNSSSSSFIITNMTNESKTIVDFAEENINLVQQYNNMYDVPYNQKQIINDAKKRLGRNSNDEYRFKPHESKRLVFGDSDGDDIGQIYDYMLRDKGKSESFKWKFDEYLR
jgi:hypothetical protein